MRGDTLGSARSGLLTDQAGAVSFEQGMILTA